MMLRIDPDDLQVAARTARRTVMARHLLALDDTAWGGAAASATEMPVAFLHAVRCPLAREIVTLHGPRKAAALAGARHIDRLGFRKGSDIDLRADLKFARRAADLANESLRFAIRLGGRVDNRFAPFPGAFAVKLGDMTTPATAGTMARDIPKTKLHRLVPIALTRTNLQNVAGARLDDSHRNDFPRLVVDLCHLDLAAEDS